jgi:hypothetical protein
MESSGGEDLPVVVDSGEDGNNNNKKQWNMERK